MRPPTEMELTHAKHLIKIKGPYWVYLYSHDVIKGRWPEGEATIATDSRWAYLYAKDVIKGRFQEAESVIAKDTFLAPAYLKAFPEAKLEWAINGLMDWTDL